MEDSCYRCGSTSQLDKYRVFNRGYGSIYDGMDFTFTICTKCTPLYLNLWIAENDTCKNGRTEYFFEEDLNEYIQSLPKEKQDLIFENQKDVGRQIMEYNINSFLEVGRALGLTSEFLTYLVEDVCGYDLSEDDDCPLCAIKAIVKDEQLYYTYDEYSNFILMCEIFELFIDRKSKAIEIRFFDCREIDFAVDELLSYVVENADSLLELE